MLTDAHIIEKPIKYASLAALVFAGSAFLLGYVYQSLAFAAMDMSSVNSGSWGEIQAISAFSIDRTIRYFIFYFMTFLSLACFARSSVRSSPWALLILFAAIPSVMSFVPFLFSDDFRAGSHWALLAMLIALIFLGVGPKASSRPMRLFFFLLVVTILLNGIISEASMWLNEIHKVALKVYGERLAEGKAWPSLFYFAPVALVTSGVTAYLIYWLPRNFIRELNDQLEMEKHEINVH